MNCIIADDDEMARRTLAHLCERIEGIKVVATCGSAREALRSLRRESIDVLLLSSDIPDIAALKALQSSSELPQILMVTRPNGRQVDLDFNITDFLSKPISQGRLTKSFDRVRRRNRMLQRREDVPELYVKVDGRLVRVPHNEILYIEGSEIAVRLFTVTGDFEVESSIKEMAGKLSDSHFLKVNRSFVINLKAIQKVAETAIHLPGKVVSISRARRPVLMRHLNLL